MATPTYDPIASTTLTLPALSVTFSSLDTIAAGYRDLVLVVAGTGGGQLTITFNSDSGSNYSYVAMQGNGSTASSFSGTTTTISGLNLNFVESNNTMQIFDFATTDKHKSVLLRRNSPGNAVAAYANRWANTAAITQIDFSGTMNAGSTFSLYGIAAV